MADSKVASAREAMEGTDCSLLGVYFSHFFYRRIASVSSFNRSCDWQLIDQTKMTLQNQYFYVDFVLECLSFNL